MPAIDLAALETRNGRQSQGGGASARPRFTRTSHAPKGDIVWEFINPYFADSALGEGRVVHTNWVYRAQPVPYDWIPEGTPHSEKAVAEIDPAQFHVPVSP
jgi:hypothetical protein